MKGVWRAGDAENARSESDEEDRDRNWLCTSEELKVKWEIRTEMWGVGGDGVGEESFNNK